MEKGHPAASARARRRRRRSCSAGSTHPGTCWRRVAAACRRLLPEGATAEERSATAAPRRQHLRRRRRTTGAPQQGRRCCCCYFRLLPLLACFHHQRQQKLPKSCQTPQEGARKSRPHPQAEAAPPHLPLGHRRLLLEQPWGETPGDNSAASTTQRMACGCCRHNSAGEINADHVKRTTPRQRQLKSHYASLSGSRRMFMKAVRRACSRMMAPLWRRFAAASAVERKKKNAQQLLSPLRQPSANLAVATEAQSKQRL